MTPADKSTDSPAALPYVTLTSAARAALVRDRLAQLETEHYRLRVAIDTPPTGQPNPSDQSRAAELAAQIKRLHAKLSDLDAEAQRAAGG